MLQDIRGLIRKILAGNWVIFTARELWLLIAVIATLVALALYALFNHIEPPPPKQVTISAGAKSGAYYQYAQRYAAQMKKHGITLNVLESSGSVENLTRINDNKSQVDFAFIQTGITAPETIYESLESLASVAYEPVWVFSKSAGGFKRLTDLKGKRVAIGAPGSGTQPVATALLNANDVSASNATLAPIAAAPAMEALARGELDAVMFIAAPSAPVVRDAFAAGYALMEFEQADALVRRFTWLGKVVVPRGSMNIATDLPTRDLTLVAATANLVARTDTHRAIAFLLMDIAADTHSAPGPLHNLRQFPNELNLVFAQSEESKRFFKTGRPFLQRYLPFWLANLIERLVVSIVPALAIAIPLFKLVPAFFDYRERAALLLVYEECHHLDHDVTQGKVTATQAHTRLDEIEERVRTLGLGASHHIDICNLRSHLDLLRARAASAKVA